MFSLEIHRHCEHTASHGSHLRRRPGQARCGYSFGSVCLPQALCWLLPGDPATRKPPLVLQPDAVPAQDRRRRHRRRGAANEDAKGAQLGRVLHLAEVLQGQQPHSHRFARTHSLTLAAHECRRRAKQHVRGGSNSGSGGCGCGSGGRWSCRGRSGGPLPEQHCSPDTPPDAGGDLPQPVFFFMPNGRTARH